jgi:hypothetical protein
MASAANAVPSVSLVWTGSSGTGATGGSSIDALAGDALTLTIFVSNTVPASGLSFAGVSLAWGGGLTGVSATECPTATSTPMGGNILAGTCTPTGFAPPTFLAPFAPGVVIGVGGAGSFDAGVAPPSFTTGTLELGAISFTTTGSDTVSIVYSPGLDSVNDGTGSVFFPGASASVNVVPEPATAGLLALGLGALGVIGRRRS